MSGQSAPTALARPQTNLERLIVALDVPEGRKALDLVDRLGNEVLWYKVGMELFYVEGPSFLSELRRRGKEIFLDLKLHDIPNTMASALRSLSAHEVGLTTVHIPAGPAALEAVAETAQALREAGTRPPQLLGVTRLTSLPAPDPDLPWSDVVDLAGDAVRAGLDGWIAPVAAGPLLRQAHGERPILVCPGIRLPEGDRGDQVAIGTPEAAISGGADWIVVGRPITRAVDPALAARTIIDRMP